MINQTVAFNRRQPHLKWVALSLVFLIAALSLFFIGRTPPDPEEGVFRIITDTGSGTGFKVSNANHMVTNHHVIDGSRSITIAFMADGALRDVSANVIWYSSDKDLAILKADTDLPGRPAALAPMDADVLHKTDNVVAVGFPGLADRISQEIRDGVIDQASLSRARLDATVSTGSIQRMVETVQRLAIQHSADINSGNSGGPLLDICGRVVGVNTFQTTDVLRASDIVRALQQGGVRIGNGGELEFAVHVREVILALQEKSVPHHVSGGRCRDGLVTAEIGYVGASTLLAIASAFMAAVTLRSSPIPYGAVASLGKADDFDLSDTTNFTPQQNTCHLVFTDDANGLVLATLDADRLSHGDGVIIGRSADIIINHPSVSRQQAIIRRHGDDFVLHDLGSTNGSWVDGKEATRTHGCVLSNGSRIKLGDIQIQFTIEGQATDPAHGRALLLSGFDSRGNTIQHTIPLVPAAASAGRLNISCTVGRDRSNNFVILDSTVSRHHACIGVNHHGVMCAQDLGSSNGTTIDGQAVGRSPIPLTKARSITFGDAQLSISVQT